MAPDAEKAALGRQEFRGQGSGWKSAAVYWARKLTASKPKCVIKHLKSANRKQSDCFRFVHDLGWRLSNSKGRRPLFQNLSISVPHNAEFEICRLPRTILSFLMTAQTSKARVLRNPADLGH
jgi:hypothetical protein